ncbi:hypothetical protein BH23PLA1_BH23PLA1_36490 [soil metagenome]
MPVRVQCPNPACQASYSVADEALGHKGRCPKCRQTFELYPTLHPVEEPAYEPSSAFPSDLSVGARFADRYEILKELGRGGMGAVYLATDTKLRRKVALKVPHFRPDESAEIVRRFEREAHSAAGLDHPNICPVFDVGQVGDIHYLTMAYIEGRPLSDVLKTDPILPQRQAAEIIRTLALALQAAHDQGVIHRDLKPSNILMHAQRGPIVMDFGLARVALAGEVSLTPTGAILGTPHYMSPEQAQGENSIGPATDIYTLGVILYQLLTGRLPFREQKLTALLIQITTTDPEPPSVHRPDLNPRLASICQKAMARNPADRYGSMTELAEALGKVLEPPAARPVPNPPSRPRPAPVPPPPVPPPPAPPKAIDEVLKPPAAHPVPKPSSRPRPAPAPPPPVPFWRRPELGIVAGFGVLLMLGVVLYIVNDRGRITIDIQDPDAVRVVLIDERKYELEVLNEPLTLRTGQHELEVHWRNLEVETRSFQIRRGDGNPVVTVQYTPKPEPPVVAQAEPIKPEAPPIVIEPEVSPEPKPAPPAVAMVEPEPAPDRARPVEPPRELTSSIGMTLVRIEPGSFLMGSTEDQSEQIMKLYPDAIRGLLEWEKPQHRIEITKPFYLGVHEVTVGQFRRFVEETNYRTDAEKDSAGGSGWNEAKGQFELGSQYHWRNPGFAQTDDHPVVNVSYNDALAFCAWLSGKDGRTYRLPSEAEWEYACRAGTRGVWGVSDDPESLVHIANVADATARRKYPAWPSIKGDDGFLYTAPVGSFRVNRWGLYDMIGNVWEWCMDGFDESYYASSPASDPPGPSGASGASDRVYRGGSWNGFPQGCRPANRSRDAPTARCDYLGFRVAAVQ